MQDGHGTFIKSELFGLVLFVLFETIHLIHFIKNEQNSRKNRVAGKTLCQYPPRQLPSS